MLLVDVLAMFPVLVLKLSYTAAVHWESYGSFLVKWTGLPAAGGCWCRCVQTQWTPSSLWRGAAMDGAVQLSPSTSHCHASLQRKSPEPWERKRKDGKGGWLKSVGGLWLCSVCKFNILSFRTRTSTTSPGTQKKNNWRSASLTAVPHF